MLTLHMELTALSRNAASTACCKESCHAHTKISPRWAGGSCHDVGAESEEVQPKDMMCQNTSHLHMPCAHGAHVENTGRQTLTSASSEHAALRTCRSVSYRPDAERYQRQSGNVTR